MDNKISFGTAFKVTVGTKGPHIEARKEICGILTGKLVKYAPKVTEGDRFTMINTSVKPGDPYSHLRELTLLKEAINEVSDSRYTLDVANARLESCIKSAKANEEYHRQVNIEFPNVRL